MITALDPIIYAPLAGLTIGCILGGITMRVTMRRRIEEAYRQGQEEVFVRRSNAESKALTLEQEFFKAQQQLEEKNQTINKLTEESARLTHCLVAAERLAARSTELSSLIEQKTLENETLVLKLKAHETSENNPKETSIVLSENNLTAVYQTLSKNLDEIQALVQNTMSTCDQIMGNKSQALEKSSIANLGQQQTK